MCAHTESALVCPGRGDGAKVDLHEIERVSGPETTEECIAPVISISQ